jgi:hypothetical protein
VILSWTRLHPSAHERRWRIAGLAGAIAVSVLLAYFAAFREPRRPVVVWTAWAVSVAAVGLVAAQFRPQVAREIAIDARGVVHLRAAASLPQVEPDRPIRPIFAAPWLITLLQGTMSVAIWPDSLPPDAYRRLWVCVRWGRQSSLQQAPKLNNE